MAEPQSSKSSFTLQGDASRPSSRKSSLWSALEKDQHEIDLGAVEAGPADTPEPLFSVFTSRQAIFIAAMASMGAFFSSISANIYFPALNPLAHAFDVTPALINLTLTGYQLCQAFAPLFIGDLADAVGRRPAYLVCFVICIASNIGIALCPSYAALVFFRCMQSTGSSGTISLSNGVVADIVDSSRRGKWSCWTTAGYSIAPALGPVLGGLLAQYLGWRSIFWFLVISASTYIFVFALFFPETSRKVVGNGSIEPQAWNRPLVAVFSSWRRKRSEKSTEKASSQTPKAAPTQKNGRSFRFPNPLNGLKLLKEKDLGLVLIFNAVLFGHYYFMLTTTPYLFAKKYHFDTFQIGLCYLPVGIMALLSQVCNGNLHDWNFQRIANNLGVKIDHTRKQDLSNFPIEKSRLQVIMPLAFMTIICNFTYGWVMELDNAPLPVALVLQGLVGFANPAAFAGLNCLVTDLFPQKPATASAANNLCRCLYVAAVTAAVIPLVEAIGTGPTFTIGSGLLLALTPIWPILVKKGPAWRAERAEKEAQKDAAKERRRQESMQTDEGSVVTITNNEKS